MATKREQITNFLNKNGFASTFQGDQFEQVVNAIELYTSKKENRVKKVAMSDEELKGYKDLAEKYNSFFPAIKIPTSGKYAKDPLKEITEALIWFTANYDFTHFMILQAAQDYVNERQLEDWKFMQTSKYFIRKQQKDKSWVSSLANYCQQVKDGVGEFKSQLPEIKNRVV